VSLFLSTVAVALRPLTNALHTMIPIIKEAEDWLPRLQVAAADAKTVTIKRRCLIWKTKRGL